jgi:hypothetical protein
MNKKWMVFTLTLALAFNALGVFAQTQKERRTAVAAPPVEQDVVLTRQGPGDGPPPDIDITAISSDNFVFVSTEMSFDGKIVKGAPYSAQAVTESVQTLADGNRIVHKNTAQVYRDSEGRTRRDQAIGQIGPYAAAGDPPQTIFINDPVAGVNYILDPRSKVARKLPRIEFQINKGMEGRFEIERKAAEGQDSSASSAQRASKSPKDGEAKPGDGGGFVFTTRTPHPGADVGPDIDFFSYKTKAETKTEKLEARNVEGVMAEGTRMTTTIPAGEIGNEQPIEIVHERWYSPELQTVVMTRHSDPRIGETIYKLTNIQRTEPSPTLFQVPSDYTLKEGPSFGPGGIRRMKKPLPPQQQEN